MDRKKIKWMGIFISIVIVVIAGALWLRKGGLELDPDQSKGSLDGMSETQLQELMDEKVKEGSLMISINTEPEFENGKGNGTLRIENSAQNRYLMVVKLYLLKEDGNDGDLIYESGAIKPGYKIEKDKLMKNLKKGRYPVIAYFEGYDQETNDFIGKVASKLTVLIRK